MQVVRGATVLVLWPLLSRVGYGLSWREGLVLVWAGLRGAVGLSLSLFVLLNKVRCEVPPFHRLNIHGAFGLSLSLFILLNKVLSF